MEMKTKYEKHRSDERLELVTMGQLDIAGTKYGCIVDNISGVGAAVRIEPPDHHHLLVGDPVTLHVLLLAPVEYHCRVARIDSDRVGLQFVGN